MMRKLCLFAVVVFAILCEVNSESERRAAQLITEGDCGDNLRWEFDQDTYILGISGSGEMYNYSNTDGLTSPWMDDFKHSIQFVVINGATSIGDYAFYDLPNLEDVSMGESVTSIGNYSFGSCSSLLNVGLSNSLETIGIGAFSSCSSLTSITIPDSVSSIGNSAFNACTGLDDVIIPDGITSIETNTFKGCTSLKNVSIPDSVTSIGDYAFRSCGLTAAAIPDGVITIGDGAFQYCEAITVIVIPESVVSIGGNAFMFKTSIFRTLYYSGTLHNFTETLVFGDTVHALDSCWPPSNNCVSPDYNMTQFCGFSLTLEAANCVSYRALFDTCSEAVYVNGSFVQRQRKNATRWQEQTNECIRYECVNGAGGIARSSCNSDDTVSRTCINNKCVEESSLKEDKVVVEITLDDGVKITDVDLNDILEFLKGKCGIDEKDVTIGWEGNDGYVIRIVVFVDDETTAVSITVAIDDLDKGEGCPYGVICKAKGVRILVNGQELSSAPMVKISFVLLMLMAVIHTVRW